MKKLVLAAAFATAATTSFAGGMSAPAVEAPVTIIEDAPSTGSSSSDLVLSAILLLIIGAAAS